MAENRELALVLRLVADEFKNELRSSQGALSGFNDFIKDWRTQLTIAGTALFAIAKSTANFGEEALKGAQRAGTTVAAYTALAHAANMADLEGQQLTVAMKGLSQSIAEASRGSGEGAKLFTGLGVSATTASGQVRPTVDVLLELADVFSKMPDGALKADAAVRLFGQSGLNMIPFLNQGKAGISELMREAQRLGVVMSKDTALAASKFNDEIKKLEASAQGFKLAIGKELIGPLTQLMQSMGDAATGPVSKVFKLEMQGLASIFTLLGHGLKELSMELDIFFKKMGASASMKKFWDDVLVQSRKNLDQQTDKRLHQIFQDQLGAVGGGESPKPSGGRDVFMGATVPVLADQEKLGKAKLEIFLAQNRALEIQAKLAREAAAGPNELFLAFDRQAQFKKEDEAEQARRGQAIVQRTQFEVQLRDQAAARERESLVKNAQAWVDYGNQVGASMEAMYDGQMELLRASLANQLQLTTEESGRLLIAWQNHDSQLQEQILNRTTLTAQERETVEIQSLTKLAAINQQYSGDIFQGWALGLQRYVQDTQSAFGMGAQMAQRTAQFMEQSFRQFFFDVMDNKIKSLKDLFSSFANFAKQIIAQVMAQLATAVALKALTGGFGGIGGGMSELFGGLGGRNVSGIDVGAMKFASGGMVLGAGNQDTVRAMLTPGEGVLNRHGMQALAKLNDGGVQTESQPNISINIVNSGRTDAPQVNYRRQLKGMIVDIIYRDPDLRQAFGGA